MTVAELIEHLKTFPQDAIVGYEDPCFGGMDIEAEFSNIFYSETSRPAFVRIGDNGECHLD